MLETTISDINSDGEGLVRIGEERFVLFVPNALPGERVQLRVVVKKRNYGLAKVIRRLSDSPVRTTPRCPAFGRCGGCQLQHIVYPAQLEMKRKVVVDALERIGGIASPNVAECVQSPHQWGYRNKVSLPVQNSRGERMRAGFYRPRSHDIIPYSHCPTLLPQMDEALAKMLGALRADGFCGVRDNKRPVGREMIRHIVIRRALNGGDMLCTIVCGRTPAKKERARLAAIVSAINGISGLSVDINESTGNFIWGGRTQAICGAQTMTEQLGDFKFEFEASSFFQVNTEQAFTLYKEATSLALADSPQSILELYSGVGTLTTFLASRGAHVTAVESWRPAAKFILPNAHANGINSVVAHIAEAEDIIESLTTQKFDVTVLDPPRGGCDEKVVAALLKISPKRIVYVSCNPATLARDAKALIGGGYRFVSARPFDMFPQTGHVETVTLFLLA